VTTSKKRSDKKEETGTKKETIEFAQKLRGDKSLSKSKIIKYIVTIIQKNKEKYTLDYLRALKYNLDAINLSK
jgi:hypothetical protein